MDFKSFFLNFGIVYVCVTLFCHTTAGDEEEKNEDQAVSSLKCV